MQRGEFESQMISYLNPALPFTNHLSLVNLHSFFNFLVSGEMGMQMPAALQGNGIKCCGVPVQQCLTHSTCSINKSECGTSHSTEHDEKDFLRRLVWGNCAASIEEMTVAGDSCNQLGT